MLRGTAASKQHVYRKSDIQKKTPKGKQGRDNYLVKQKRTQATQEATLQKCFGRKLRKPASSTSFQITRKGCAAFRIFAALQTHARYFAKNPELTMWGEVQPLYETHRPQSIGLKFCTVSQAERTHLHVGKNNRDRKPQEKLASTIRPYAFVHCKIH